MKKCKVFRTNGELLQGEVTEWLKEEEVEEIYDQSQSSVGDVIILVMIYEGVEDAGTGTDADN